MPCNPTPISIRPKAQIDGFLRDPPAFSAISSHTILFITIRLFFLKCKVKRVPAFSRALSGTSSCPALWISQTCLCRQGGVKMFESPALSSLHPRRPASRRNHKVLTVPKSSGPRSSASPARTLCKARVPFRSSLSEGGLATVVMSPVMNNREAQRGGQILWARGWAALPGNCSSTLPRVPSVFSLDHLTEGKDWAEEEHRPAQ